MSRRRPTEGHLVARSALLVAGGALALVGMMLELRWLVWLSMGVLVAAYALRFAARRDGVSDVAEDEEVPL